MGISRTGALERIARVLAGIELSSNGYGDGRSVGREVDEDWRRHLDSAAAVLNSLREPDARMTAVGDAEAWTRMVEAALGKDVQSTSAMSRSWAAEPEIYQKPLG